MTSLYALGLGIGTQNSKGEWLEVFYAAPLLNPSASVASAIAKVVAYSEGNAAIAISNAQAGDIAQALEGVDAEQAALAKSLVNSKRPLVVTLIATDTNPASVPEGYLKLHLLSHRLVKPHNTVLAGIFGVLPNVAWTNKGAIDVNELPAAQLQARLNGEDLEVSSVDKFPKNDQLRCAKRCARCTHGARAFGRLLGRRHHHHARRFCKL